MKKIIGAPKICRGAKKSGGQKIVVDKSADRGATKANVTPLCV